LPPSTGTLSLEAVRRLQQIACDHLGLEQRSGKEQVIRLRAARHMRELGIQNAGEYLRVIESDSAGDHLRDLLDRLTTNHTAFWREASHFEWFERWLGGRHKSQMTTIWCAAASTGEEPYTLAMIGHKVFGASAPAKLRILATDVSTRVLETARQGIYSADRIKALPASWGRQFFEEGHGPNRGKLRVRQRVREMVHFKRLNLVLPFPAFGPFPVVFCRNVMIYFSQDTRAGIIRRLLQVIEPGGHLLVGHAEGLAGMETEVEFVQSAIYRKTPGGPADKECNVGWTAQGAQTWQHS